MENLTKKTTFVALIMAICALFSPALAEDPPAKATGPWPRDGGVQVKVNPDLAWTAGSGATSHDVYFGTTSPGIFQGNQNDPDFDPGGLDNNTTYYWRIDEKNGGGTTTGNVWSFTTRPEPMQMPAYHLRGGMFLRPDGHWDIDSAEGFRDIYQMKRLGVGWVSVHINEYQDGSSTITPWYHKWTHYPDEIRTAVQKAQQLGMKVIIRLSKPQAWENALDDEELADPTGWFATYENYAFKYATLAEELGVDLFAIGSELDTAFLDGYDTEWTSIINGIRARYSGPLFFTVAGNGFLKNGNSVSFWDELDYIGVNAYFKLTMIDTGNCVYTEAEGDYDPTLQELMDQYNCIMTNIEDFRISAGLTNMPVIFGEGGYRSTDGCNMKIKTPPVDIQEQADCVNAMYSQAPRRSWWKGMNYWKFSTINGEGGEFDISQGVRGKKAQDHFAHNYMAVDHFDHYGHAEGDSITDNWSVATGSATITLESTTVHGGDYASKFAYNTTSSACEIQRDIAEIADWSGDYSHITLWFKGDSGRTGENLTLQVVDSGGLVGEATYTDGAGLTDWTCWEIDLNSDLSGGSGDLTAVTAIKLKLDSGGGAGDLYVDEIVRLPIKAIPIHPFDGDTGVCPDDDINWRSGYEAVSHDVYCGLSSTAVNNATTASDEFLGNTTIPSFALGCLDNNQTYYWRVDEVAPDETVTKGDIWDFTTGTYYISSGDFEGEEVGDTVEVRRRWAHVLGSSMTTTVVDNDSHSGSQSLKWEYDNSGGICEVQHNRNTGYLQWQDQTTGFGIWVKGNANNTGDVTISTILWDDTTTLQKTFTNATQNSTWTLLEVTESDFSPADLEGVKQFRITVSQESGANPGVLYIDDVVRITGKISGALPADGDVAVDPNENLYWHRGTNADSHDVYFGTDQTAVSNATTSSDEYMGNNSSSNFNLSYEPGALSDETTYYWRIDRKESAVTTKGDVWSFTTGTDTGGGGTPGQTHNFDTTDDSYCKQNGVNKNFGTSTKLAVRNESTGTGLRSFLKFTVSGLTDDVYSAKLKLYSSTAAANVMCHGVDNTTWTENNITWGNMPALGTLMDTVAVSPGAWYEFDVTSHVTGNGTFSFGLDTDYAGGEWYHFNSKEASNTPVLKVTESTGGTPDTDPPTPDPATFASAPATISDTEITMTATTGSDATGGPVEYYFDETSDNPGATDSGWVTDPVYNDTGLTASTQYTYTVQMRDALLNTGTASAPANATTTGGCTATDIHIEAVVCAEVSCGGPKKNGQVTVTIYDDCGDPVINALVDGTFTGDFSETFYDVATDQYGEAVFTTAGCIKKPSFTFTVDDVAGTLPYDSNDDLATGCSG